MSDRKTLTPRQRQVYHYIKGCITNRGYGPTVREMMKGFGIKSPNGVMCHLKALERKGYIERDACLARGIRLARQQDFKMSMAGTINAGPLAIASENLEIADFSELFRPGNSTQRAVFTKDDYWVYAPDGERIALIRRSIAIKPLAR